MKTNKNVKVNKNRSNVLLDHEKINHLAVIPYQLIHSIFLSTLLVKNLAYKIESF